MNVLLLNDSFPPLTDGVANTVLNYARILNSRFDSAMVATPAYPGVKDDYPFEVIRYKSFNTENRFGYRTGFPFDRVAVRRLASFDPDIIHVHCPVTSMMMARELKELTGAPIIFTYHTKFDQDVRRMTKSRLLQKAVIHEMINNIKAADEVWACNVGAGENLVELGYPGRFIEMPNGVDMPKGKSSAADVREIEEKYHIPADRPMFLFVGRMMWYKGQHIILDALKALKDSGKKFFMVFIGDGDNLEDLKKEIEFLGLQNDCITTGTILDRRVLKAFYSRASLFLLPSVYDNNPLVVKEAAASLTASVLVRNSSPAEGVTDGVNCLLIDQSAGSMYRVLMDVIDDEEKMRTLGENAARDLYLSWDDCVSVAHRRYEEFLSSYRPEKPKARGSIGGAVKMFSYFQKASDRFGKNSKR